MELKQEFITFKFKDTATVCYAYQIPICASNYQIILTDNINEIQSVLFMDFKGKVIWKFGKPKDDDFRKKLEVAVFKKFTG